jgi:hypothetical protein
VYQPRVRRRARKGEGEVRGSEGSPRSWQTWAESCWAKLGYRLGPMDPDSATGWVGRPFQSRPLALRPMVDGAILYLDLAAIAVSCITLPRDCEHSRPSVTGPSCVPGARSLGGCKITPKNFWASSPQAEYPAVLDNSNQANVRYLPDGRQAGERRDKPACCRG